MLAQILLSTVDKQWTKTISIMSYVNTNRAGNHQEALG